jgi:hypothetical protein
MKSTLNLLLAILPVLFFSCSSPGPRESRLDVRPGIDGVHRVVIISKNQVEGSREALNQADQYCKEIKKSAYFFNSAVNDDAATTKAKAKPAYSAQSTSGTKKPAAEETEADKSLTIDMLFKCL